MNVIYSCSAAMEALVRDALARCTYPHSYVSTNWTIEEGTTFDRSLHGGKAEALTYNDGLPTAAHTIFNPGLLDPNDKALYRGYPFALETVIHELGHVITLQLGPSDLAAVQSSIHCDSGHWANPGNWSHSGQEGAAETFKDLYLPPSARAYNNRTIYRLQSQADEVQFCTACNHAEHTAGGGGGGTTTYTQDLSLPYELLQSSQALAVNPYRGIDLSAAANNNYNGGGSGLDGIASSWNQRGAAYFGAAGYRSGYAFYGETDFVTLNHPGANILVELLDVDLSLTDFYFQDDPFGGASGSPNLFGFTYVGASATKMPSTDPHQQLYGAPPLDLFYPGDPTAWPSNAGGGSWDPSSFITSGSVYDFYSIDPVHNPPVLGDGNGYGMPATVYDASFPWRNAFAHGLDTGATPGFTTPGGGWQFEETEQDLSTSAVLDRLFPQVIQTGQKIKSAGLVFASAARMGTFHFRVSQTVTSSGGPGPGPLVIPSWPLGPGQGPQLSPPSAGVAGLGVVRRSWQRRGPERIGSVYVPQAVFPPPPGGRIIS